MENFFPDQRWTSAGEPELGVGIVTETSKGRVKLHFPIADEVRQYTVENAPLRRVVFKPGDSIADKDKRPLMVERVEADGHLFIYIGQGRQLSEADLGDVSVKHGVDDRLFMGDVDTPELFALRRKTLYYDHNRRISPINGFVGGRIDLIPHQLYIAHEVSSRHAPRVLLSDQVGLGKTIEACLILHRLLLTGRISRVLILVPDSLVHQWFVEMLRRFNLWFHIYDEVRCASLDGGAPDANPFLDDQLIICSTSFLAGSQVRARQALSAGWDMLVVDEAHHLEWSVDKVSPEYGIVELLSKAAKGLLLLTATPEQLGVESHFARLRLLDPDRYANYEAFKNEPHDYKAIANIVEALSSGKPLQAADTQLLESMFGKERLTTLAKEGETANNNLIEDLLDQHGPGRVVFRNTRSAMSGFPKRKAHLVPIKADEQHNLWIDRLSQEYALDSEPSLADAPSQKFWFEEDPRVSWLVKLMKKLKPAKAVLICRSKEKVLALESALGQLSGIKVAVFHEDLTIVQRDRNAAWFAEPDGARLLLCSEIGSEGRNFQFAHHLILFDLPAHPELLEQRIGRLDRIGQSEDIQIHVPYLIGSPQEVLVRWFHEGLNAFEENLEGGNQLAQLFGERLKEATQSVGSPKADNQLKSLIADTATFQQDLKQMLANGRDRLLEMNSFRPEVAKKLMEQIGEADLDMGLEKYMIQVFHHFSIDMEDLAPRTYLLHPTQANTYKFPSLPDEGMAVTFDRKRALAREDMSFVSWDHPMTTGAMDMVLSLGTGGASYGVLRGTRNSAILLEVLFVLETSGGQSTHVDRFLPATPLRVVVDHGGEDVTDDYPIELFDQHLRPGRVEDMLENDTLVDEILPSMLKAATAVAEGLKADEVLKGMQEMSVTMNHEIGRLKALHDKNENVRPEEIQLALEERAKLASLIKNARIRMDAVQLVREGE
ncbi:MULTISPECIES: RNA polymerase-associated protein RapA [unclassified Imperialibacter]|uniref:RNA polymerase-associated protein RapA n=1 Tax=unclassified Imperialibacter TaxID=2629706 RepID=UPI0012550513|nr:MULTISPECIES: RNA polymerase-associated protein RapA [unclassified Imperialibacter]CAD5293487.1 RNA polymerase-associated protein RapA [Imperialibacter sp. 89]CAD5294567.1 RNA polymerase-associated protein RapA [Imperialibacter sp. 75]VVT18173.1 RNA polymerase-associated protein RapA [Imperialibacter sp. EC-SDR9]